MSLSLSRSGKAASAVLIAAVLTAWRVWQGKRRRKTAGSLLVLSSQTNSKVLDLRDEASFRKAHIRGSHNIPAASLWDENRWYELPEQHEPLIVLMPEEGAPDTSLIKRRGGSSSSNSLAAEIRNRRADGCTATLVFDQALLKTARESGLLLEEGKEKRSALDGGATAPPSPTTTLFTPSPFLTRAVAVIEPHLRHAWLPLTCIDIGCGAGRDAVWLAKRGWTVLAMDSWKQALGKAVQLAHRNGVSDRVEVVRGKVKYTGEIHLSTKAEEAQGGKEKVVTGAHEGSGGEGCGAATSFTGPSVSTAAGTQEERILCPSTPSSEHGAYALVVAIRFLERSAFDTLARLVDPRGGYILLSTFIEEETETAPLVSPPSSKGVGSFGRSDSGPLGRKGKRSAGNVTTSPASAAEAKGGPERGEGGRKAFTSLGNHGGVQQGGRPGQSIDAHPDAAAAAAAAAPTAGADGASASCTSTNTASSEEEEEREEDAASAKEQAGYLLAAPPGPGVTSGGKGEAEVEKAHPRDKKEGVAGNTPVARKRKPGSAAAALEAAAAAATMARWPHASPRDPKKILRRGELARHFGGRHGFEVLEDTVERLPDGRPVACFLARKMPLVVSSPSNASSNSSSPWREDLPPRKSPRQLQEQQQQQKTQSSQPLEEHLSGRASTPASSFGAGATKDFFLGKLAPMPEGSALKGNEEQDDAEGGGGGGRGGDGGEEGGGTRGTRTPASFFPDHPAAAVVDAATGEVEGRAGADQDNGDGGGGGGGVDEAGDGRAKMWSGFPAVGSGSRRDFTASRAASTRRLAAQQQSRGGSVFSGVDGGDSG